MSDDAIQELIDDTVAGICHQPTIERAQAQHTAHRDKVAALRSSLEGRAAEVAELRREVAHLREHQPAWLPEMAAALGVRASQWEELLEEARRVRERAEKAERERDEARASLDRCTRATSAVWQWTLEHGADLIPRGSDTYGEGKRDAKATVGRIIGDAYQAALIEKAGMSTAQWVDLSRVTEVELAAGPYACALDDDEASTYGAELRRWLIEKCGGAR